MKIFKMSKFCFLIIILSLMFSSSAIAQENCVVPPVPSVSDTSNIADCDKYLMGIDSNYYIPSSSCYYVYVNAQNRRDTCQLRILSSKNNQTQTAPVPVTTQPTYTPTKKPTAKPITKTNTPQPTTNNSIFTPTPSASASPTILSKAYLLGNVVNQNDLRTIFIVTLMLIVFALGVLYGKSLSRINLFRKKKI